MSTETTDQYPGVVPGSKEELIRVVETLLRGFKGSEQILKSHLNGYEVSDQAEGVAADFESVETSLDELFEKYVKPYGTQ